MSVFPGWLVVALRVGGYGLIILAVASLCGAAFGEPWGFVALVLILAAALAAGVFEAQE